MDSQTQLNDHPNIKKVVSLESFVFMAIFLAVFGLLGSKMGMINMLNTMMQTAYQLLLDTVFYIMAIAVLAGALSGLFTEFGIVAIINKVLSPLMKPVYDLPGASVVGILATYLSDNPAILTLAEDQGFRRYFKRYQLPALTNIGTAFGMGLIITSFMVGIASPTGESFVVPALIGNLGAIIGSIVSVRLMHRQGVRQNRDVRGRRYQRHHVHRLSYGPSGQYRNPFYDRYPRWRQNRR